MSSRSRTARCTNAVQCALKRLGTLPSTAGATGDNAHGRGAACAQSVGSYAQEVRSYAQQVGFHDSKEPRKRLDEDDTTQRLSSRRRLCKPWLLLRMCCLNLSSVARSYEHRRSLALETRRALHADWQAWTHADVATHTHARAHRSSGTEATVRRGYEDTRVNLGKDWTLLIVISIYQRHWKDRPPGAGSKQGRHRHARRRA